MITNQTTPTPSRPHPLPTCTAGLTVSSPSTLLTGTQPRYCTANLLLSPPGHAAATDPDPPDRVTFLDFFRLPRRWKRAAGMFLLLSTPPPCNHTHTSSHSDHGNNLPHTPEDWQHGGWPGPVARAGSEPGTRCAATGTAGPYWAPSGSRGTCTTSLLSSRHCPRCNHRNDHPGQYPGSTEISLGDLPGHGQSASMQGERFKCLCHANLCVATPTLMSHMVMLEVVTSTPTSCQLSVDLVRVSTARLMISMP